MKMLIRCATGNVMLGSHCRVLSIDSESHRQKEKVNKLCLQKLQWENYLCALLAG